MGPQLVGSLQHTAVITFKILNSCALANFRRITRGFRQSSLETIGSLTRKGVLANSATPSMAQAKWLRQKPGCVLLCDDDQVQRPLEDHF